MLEFYILGDMGSGGISQNLVADALTENIGNKKTFVCGLGDNIYETGCTNINDIQFLTKFEKPYVNIPDTVKFYMCIGNHDYGEYPPGEKGNSIHQINYGKLSEKEGKKWILPSNYYSFRKQNRDVIIDFFLPSKTKEILYFF